MGRKILFITTDQMRYDALGCNGGTVYEKSSLYAGSEGELYDHVNDPQQWHNLWNDPAYQSLKSDLIADLYDHLPPARTDRRQWVASV